MAVSMVVSLMEASLAMASVMDSDLLVRLRRFYVVYN